MKTTPTTIKLTRQGKHLIIASPYDETLVENIKVLHWKQREFNRQDNTWIILEDDPEQSPDEATNLEYIRRICQEAAERRGWQFNDYTAQSTEQIEQKLAQKTDELKEEHIKAICQVLPKLPRRALKLIRWDDDSLSLQLNYYLGENDEGQALWQELKEACTKVWRHRIFCPAFEAKAHCGFVFEISSDDRVVQTLVACQIDNLNIYQLSQIQMFPDGIKHFQDTKGNLWVGKNYTEISMSDLNNDVRPWELTQTDEGLYWVTNADKTLAELLSESRPYPVHMGGNYGIFFYRNAQLPQFIAYFHLESWFKEWAIAVLNSSELSAPYSNWQLLISPDGYNHCADDLMRFLNRFMGTKEGEFILELLEISSLQLLEYKNKIQRLKEEKASEAYQEILRKAPDLASQKLNLKTKAELLKLAEKHQIPLKKSWTKAIIIASFVKDFSLCKELIGLN